MFTDTETKHRMLDSDTDASTSVPSINTNTSLGSLIAASKKLNLEARQRSWRYHALLSTFVDATLLQEKCQTEEKTSGKFLVLLSLSAQRADLAKLEWQVQGKTQTQVGETVDTQSDKFVSNWTNPPWNAL